MVYSGCSNCNLFVERFVVGMLDNTGDGDAGSLVNESFEGLLVRAVARTLIGGVYIHIFRFCPTSFF